MSRILQAVAILGVVVPFTQASTSVPLARQSITALTTAQIDAFTPYTYYASAAYCSPAQTSAWDCGAECEANPNFEPVASGGDGDSVQYWYVGYDANLETVIVAHQGTIWIEPNAVATDADAILKNLDSTLFPGVSSDIECHSGFADEQAQTATDVLAAVQKAMSKYSTTSVTMVGHSLGGAIALLDSVYLPLWLPSGTRFQTFCYGLPRVGNQAFANYVDANVHLTHVNNKEDPIPICPSTSMGYVHPSGEVHIKDSGTWVSCPGQDNPSTECIVGDVPNVWDGNINDHYGPYNGIWMNPGCRAQPL